jgi:hypothetical protein
MKMDLSQRGGEIADMRRAAAAGEMSWSGGGGSGGFKGQSLNINSAIEAAQKVYAEKLSEYHQTKVIPEIEKIPELNATVVTAPLRALQKKLTESLLGGGESTSDSGGGSNTPALPAATGASGEGWQAPTFDPSLYETETQQIMRAYQERQDEINLFKETKLISMPRFHELEIQAESDKQNALLELVKRGAADRKAIDELSGASQLKLLKSSFSDALGAWSKHSKTAFNMKKKAAIGEAVINTWKAASDAFALYPFPVNIGMAALAVAKGYSQVKQIQSAQFRAKGGPVSANQPYIVGEKGAELFVPNGQSGQIIPNDQLGGGEVNVTFNISANDTRGFDQLLQQRRGQIIGMVNQAMNDRGQRAIA